MYCYEKAEVICLPKENIPDEHPCYSHYLLA